ncbi:DNA N-6-adenine-methyltransferase [Sphaerothrix gracilis]|uniref:DNA N-6-adenine-methyltransferase n=1 Tax=Sphaerothrix gracilis TaxID=3151835 RepID=UPI0031FC6E7A
MPAIFTKCNSINDERFTPKEWMDKAAKLICIDNFEHDFATCSQAIEYHGSIPNNYTREYSFLNAHWIFKENWFLNAPFSLNLEFGYHLMKMADAGLLGDGIILCNANTETRWFRNYAKISDWVWFPSKRVDFLNPETLEPVKNNPKPQAFFIRASHIPKPEDGILAKLDTVTHPPARSRKGKSLKSSTTGN